MPLLFVCEEAHRYAAADRTIGFGPTRRALSRIAKEGRKYGVFLALVTQRPAELDPTIISQCSTLFAMRMANDHDQALLRSAVADAGANLLDFVPSLRTGEVVGFGEGMPMPARLAFTHLPASSLRYKPPSSASTMANTRSGLAGDTATPIFPMSFGSPCASRVHVSPPSTDFQIPLPGPPLRTCHGTRWWSQNAA